MRRCVSCKETAAWTWQPFGPGEIMTFTTPGAHYRGFPALALCDECKTWLETDGTSGAHWLHFTYRKQPYKATRYETHLERHPAA